MTNADRNLEPRVEAIEIDMHELKRFISDLKSTVFTLADRALMLQLIQAIAQGRNGGT